MSLLQGMSERFPFDPHTPDEHGDDKALAASFPSSYPKKDINLASRLVMLSEVADGRFGKGTTAAIARECIHLRYIDLFGPTEKTTVHCPKPLSQKEMKKIKTVLRDYPVVQLMGDGLKDIDKYAAEIEILNFMELSVADPLDSAKDIYSVLYNCFEHTLNEDPNHATGFKKQQVQQERDEL